MTEPNFFIDSEMLAPAGPDPDKDPAVGPERLGFHDPTHAKKLEFRQKEARALDLRLKGKSIRAIAQELKETDVYVSNLLRNAVNRSIRRNAMNADQLRELQLRRLDMVIEALQPRIEAGDWKSIDTYMKVLERQAKLGGFDAPEVSVHTLSVAGRMSDAELMEQARLHNLYVPAGALNDKPAVRVTAVSVDTDGDGGVRPHDDVRGWDPGPGPGTPDPAGVHQAVPGRPGVPADPPGDGRAHGVVDGEPGEVGG